MKKVTALILTIVLAISLLTSCGGKSDSKTGTASSAPKTSSSANSSTAPSNSSAPPASSDNGGNSGGGNDTNSPAQQTGVVVKASELITAEDATRILGTDMAVSVDSNGVEKDLDKREYPGSLRTVYDASDIMMFMLQVCIRQNALLDKDIPFEEAIINRGGISSFSGEIKQQYENAENTITVEGLGDWAGIVSIVGKTLYIVHGDYFLELTITGRVDKSRSDEEDAAWKIEKLTEAGKLAVERLEAIIK